ncbi:F-box/WD repeat-containing protein 7 isoform X1 [Pimephales promelas]|uniref:F-box/WD repeat-containing protein 7 isoform X1 n=2 Tax=Pimephales promelas TaxID=90988 RepID=UPI001955DE55|nr:F-box/WD repeat-containing protein 7 isoform X1 [Pimephales promelas]
MKRLGRSACCSDLLSCSHTSEHLQRLATGCPPQHKNVKPLSSSDSLAKVQEVASWLLEMNQDLLSGGSGSRAAQQQRPGEGNSSSGRTPQPQAEHVNQVLEEEEEQRREPGEEEEGRREGEEEPWPSGGELVEEGRRSEVNGAEKGAQWMWEDEQRRRRRRHRDDEEENEEEEENNNGGRDGQGLRSEEDDDRPEEEENGDEEEMDQDSDESEHSEDSGKEEEEEEAEDEEEGEDGLHSPSLRTSVSDPNDNTDQSSGRQHQSSPSVFKNKMKRKLDHGPEVRPFPSGKKPCPSPTGLPYPATPTTFGGLRAVNGQGQQRRRITSIQPPTGLQEWLRTFQSWSGPEKLLALDELIDSCEPTQVKHMMQVIEPQFQRDFISLLPRELALHVLSFLEPKDLLQAAQTCRYWRILAEDNLLWREKCKEEGIDEPLHIKRRKVIKPGFTHSPWKSAYIRQHRIDTNWRRGDLKSPKVLKGHDDHVITCLQFCGNRIVSGSDDNTLKVWSAVTGKCLRTLVGHTGGVWSSQMRDNIIISGSTDRTLKVWNAETGECIHTLYGHTSTVRCMHLHEKRVVSGSRDATLRVWDIETGQCLHVLMGHVAAVRCVQYDGRRVVSGAYDFMVKVWDPETETCLHTLQGHTNRVYSLQFDGIHVVSGSLDTSIRVWDVETGNCIHTLTGHQSLTSGMELKDNILVSGNADSTVKIWDIKTGQCLQTLQGPHKHQSAVTCLQFNKNFVITSSDDGTVKLWDLRTGEFIRNLVTLESGGSGGVVWRIRASNTKLVCAVGSRNGTEETKLLVLDFDVDMK